MNLPRFLIRPDRLSRVIAWGGVVLLVGLVSLAVWYRTGGPGLLTGMALCMLGASSGSVRQYDTEAGLWMFALLVLVFAAGFWVLFTAASLVPQFGGTPDLATAIDAVIATMAYGLLVRTMASVAVYNRAVSSRRKD